MTDEERARKSVIGFLLQKLICDERAAMLVGNSAMPEDVDKAKRDVLKNIGALLAELEACRPVVEALEDWAHCTGGYSQVADADKALLLNEALGHYLAWKQERENG